MRLLLVVLGALILVAPTLAGCSNDIFGLADKAAQRLSARPLNIPQTDFTGGDGKRDKAGLVAWWAAESVKSCTAFINDLLLGRGAVNFVSDTTSTLLSTAAAITTPVRAAHQLAAGATVVGASKTSFDNQFFASASAGTLQSVIANTYSMDMDRFLARIATTPPGQINVGLELANIQQIHANCSLGNAQATVQATVATAASPPASAASSPRRAASGANGDAGVPHTPVRPGTALQLR